MPGLSCPTPNLNTFLRTSAFYADGQAVIPADGGGIRYPIDFWDSMAPFIEITFRGGDRITVGNQSSPAHKNAAVIKSFQYSAKPARHGCTCEVEIHDIEGGNFALWFERLNKNFSDQTPARDYTMECVFGWVGHSCDGDASLRTRSQARPCDCYAQRATPSRIQSQKLYFLPKILHASYEGGKIKFKIEGIDLIQNISEVQTPKAYDEMTLKCAVINMMKEHKITKVEWKKKQPDGSCVEVGFIEGEGVQCGSKPNEGKKLAYKPLNNDPLKSALEWMKGVRSNPDKKAFIAGWNPCSQEPHLIFWEDDTPTCDCSYEPGKSLGVYLVNAGKCSPVIQFTPKTKYAFSAEPSNKGGNAARGSAENLSAEKGKEGQSKTPDQRCKKRPDAKGGEKDVSVTTGENQNDQSDDDPHKILSQQEAQERANKAFYPIEAQLRIQGDPTFVSPIMMIGRFIGIVVVNPTHYMSKEGTTRGCGDWLVTSPPINQVYSNKGWMVRGVTHQIKEGQFNTLIDVFLPSPGYELDNNIPLGCKDSGGKVI